MFDLMSAGSVYKNPEAFSDEPVSAELHYPFIGSAVMPDRRTHLFPLDEQLHKLSKRAFDIVFSLAVIVLFLSWMLPLFGLFIGLTSSGPVLFRQKRTGINNKPFWCWKFRTMYVNMDAHVKQAVPGDPRITPVGRVLRKFSLDELPQFFNVLTGNMSVVGPRPHMLLHTQQYSRMIDTFMVRHFVKPGITGLSQVQGYRGEVKCSKALRNRVKLDLFYLEKWHFMLDLRIIAKTVKLMMFGDRNAF